MQPYTLAGPSRCSLSENILYRAALFQDNQPGPRECEQQPPSEVQCVVASASTRKIGAAMRCAQSTVMRQAASASGRETARSRAPAPTPACAVMLHAI